MDKETLEKIGIACFGNTWQTSMAKALTINSRTVRRWLSGETPVSSALRQELLNLLHYRQKDLEHACDDLTFRLPSSLTFTSEEFGEVVFFDSKERAMQYALKYFPEQVNEVYFNYDYGNKTIALKEDCTIDNLVIPYCAVLEVVQDGVSRQMYACKFFKRLQNKVFKHKDLADGFAWTSYDFYADQAGVLNCNLRTT